MVEAVRFEILGPLRAWHADRELELGPGKQRAVLTVLLLQAGRPVPTNRIVDAVWAEEPPANGTNVVQKYVAGLRRVLEPGRSPRTPGQVLSLTDAGYLLRVGRDDVDALRFEWSARQATAARDAGRWPEAATGLRAALDLWRGEPLPGLTGPFFDAARHRLVELRTSALESWAELELRLGHHHEVVGELARLVAQFPVRERLRGLLMLALYREGRQAEALDTFREVRTLLRDEHGLEPGEPLQELHRRILRSDPTLAAPDRPAGPATPAPAAPTRAAPTRAEAVPAGTVAAGTAAAGTAAAGTFAAPGSAAPVEPAAPLEPVASAAPLEPVASAAPLEPVEPVASVEPAASLESVEPVASVASVQPVASAEPAVPAADARPAPSTGLPVVSVPPPVSLPPPFLPITAPPGGGQHGAPLHWTSIAGTVVGAVGILLTFGMLSWLVAFVYAWRRRSWWLLAAGFGYLVVAAGFIVAMETGDPEAPATTGESFAIFGLLLVNWLGGVLHVVLLNRGVQNFLGRGRRPPSPAVPRSATEQRVRREHARYLLYHYPSARRELRIGRPDLPRNFDDGGLIDINAVAEHVVLGLPGPSPEQSRHILVDRLVRGPYASLEQLVARCLLPMEVADSLREVLLFLPPLARPEPTAPAELDA
ncbi:BTAD domain-containing putative transcriptional regulator [Micromonospora sp. WMMD1102]|uniref:BTAD domain-containing putative transcriptional regulator n=1 Tax=Micromonospora sp. WMMD1102 TaxID=3016105 RepID=UPI0024151CBF|nr:BTAD domain-containing putative transcriptional regulator [Micromonospora sp. WMMD1102]MDG4790077.1 BTAD domain-containing putative transcriptional regulator [Micromonospora sp. WMMD1102]